MRGDVEVEDISVIVCTYNRASSLKSTLESFSGLTLPPDLDWELIVVDNNSKDNTQEVIRDFAKTARFSVRYIFERRQGRSPALNAGIVAAKGEIVAFTDDDVILHPEWLLRLKRAFDEFECAGVGGRVVPLWHHPKPDWLEMEEQQAIVNFELGDESKELKDRTPLGANSAYQKNKFAKYGVFRLDLGVSGESRGITCEDSEFASRLFRAGEKIMYVPAAIIYHPVDPVRSSKAYFCKWYYNDGRSMIRAWPPPMSIVRYFGVPRWIFRSVGENFLKWILNFDAKRRFHYKLRTYRDVGRLVESYRNRGVV
jgi:glycosyltransferase involved in cell wall biosynthesis